MQLYLRLAWRNIWRHRRRTVIITVAMGVSLALMLFYDGLIEGFDQAIYGNAVRVLGGNIQIHASGYRANVDTDPLLPLTDPDTVIRTASADRAVQSAYQRIQTGGLATNPQGAFPVGIVGIDADAERGTSIIAENLRTGTFLTAEDSNSVLIGKGLADLMELGIGDRFTLVGTDTHRQARQHTMTVRGIYDLGMASLEERTVYIPLSETQALYGLPGQSTEIVLNLKQVGQEDAVVARLAPSLPNYEVESWYQNYPEMQSALNTKGAVMNVFGVIIILISGIGILNLLLMAVYERAREIGLLGAMGMKPHQIATLFVLEGSLIGLVGAVSGIIFGVALNGALGQVGFDYTKFSNLTEYMALITGRIYPSLGIQNLIPRSLVVIVVATLAAWLPAREAAGREPADALRQV